MDSVLPGVAIASATVAVGAGFYTLIRPCFPSKVNCWFCNCSSYVPYDHRNGWYCSGCDQYNGFTKDGDYNRSIPSMYQTDDSACRPQAGSTRPEASILCQRCSTNQTLKIKQLARFEPYSEANYDAEVSAYRAYLEHEYRLCARCEQAVGQKLKRQDDLLKQRYHIDNSVNRDGSWSPTKQAYASHGGRSWFESLLHLLMTLVSLILLLHSLYELARHFRLFSRLALPIALPPKAGDVIQLVEDKQMHIALAGVGISIFCLLTDLCFRSSSQGGGICLLWIGLLLVYWRPLPFPKFSPRVILIIRTVFSAACFVKLFFASAPAKSPRVIIRRHNPPAYRGRADSDSDSELFKEDEPVHTPPIVTPGGDGILDNRLQLLRIGAQNGGLDAGASGSHPLASRHNGDMTVALWNDRQLIQPARFRVTQTIPTSSFKQRNVRPENSQPPLRSRSKPVRKAPPSSSSCSFVFLLFIFSVALNLAVMAVYLDLPSKLRKFIKY